MKILKLLAENVKRLHCVEITPEGNLVLVGGKNSAGKSSVLDAVAYAMGGEKLVPSEPIRAGETEAKIVVDLGDLVVTRKFKRSPLPCDCGVAASHREDVTDPPHAINCSSHRFGDTTSTLSVTNKEGARYPSPQAVLDKMLGKLTFDPLAFARDDPKRQDETLRRLVHLDVAPIDARRRSAFELRTMLKKSLAIKEAQLLALPRHADAPDAEISLDVISQEMLKAEGLRALAEDAERAHGQAQQHLLECGRRVESYATKIADLRKQLALEEDALAKQETLTRQAETDVAARSAVVSEARAAVPDASAIRARLAEADATNARVRMNQKHDAMKAEVQTIADGVVLRTKDIEEADDEKRAMLSSAAFPVAGLGLSDAGVTFNGLPFEQAGKAEQVRVSVAIGIALNPTLKVLLIRDGNLLDKDAMTALAAQANAADCQLWIEWVTDDKAGMTVLLVEGEVVS